MPAQLAGQMVLAAGLAQVEPNRHQRPGAGQIRRQQMNRQDEHQQQIEQRDISRMARVRRQNGQTPNIERAF